MSEQDVVYECGHRGSEVGQAFQRGVLVCPVDRVPVAPYDHPAAPARAKLRVELELEGATVAELERYVDGLTETFARDAVVASADVILEHREPANA